MEALGKSGRERLSLLSVPSTSRVILWVSSIRSTEVDGVYDNLDTDRSKHRFIYFFVEFWKFPRSCSFSNAVRFEDNFDAFP